MRYGNKKHCNEGPVMACILKCRHQRARTVVTDCLTCPLFLHWSMLDQNTKLQKHMQELSEECEGCCVTQIIWPKHMSYLIEISWLTPARVFKRPHSWHQGLRLPQRLVREFPKCDIHIAVAVNPCDRAIQFNRAADKLFQCSAEVSPVQWVRKRRRWEICADEWAVSRFNVQSVSQCSITESVG
jgi:hypothetical protein